MNYLLGVDIGTSATKTVLFDEECHVVTEASAEYPLYQPQNGWAEQNPKDWSAAAASTIREVLAKAQINPTDVKGVGLSGQMHGLVMLDEANEVIRPSIIWCDQRTAAECAEITAKIGRERLIEITANPALTGFTASKILWVRNHEPENYRRCRHILLPKDYVRFCMTGDYATEVSDASGMQLLDVPKRQWSDEILEKLDIDKDLLPKVYESPEATGHISAEFAQLTGLTTDCVVAGGAGDNAAAAVGTGVVEDGKAFTTIGTSGVVFAHTSSPRIDPQGRVHTFCCAVPGCWHVMGVTQAAGLSLKWFRENLAENMDYNAINEAINSVPRGSRRLLYLPYLMGERTPHLDPDCRGAFFGLSAMHKRADMLRAVMEGVSYSLRDCWDILKEMDVEVTDMMACGGGSKSPIWRQMLADMYDCPVKTGSEAGGPALGVAILAGVAAGIFTDVPSACRKYISTTAVCQPEAEAHQYYERGHQLYQKLYQQLKDCYQELSLL
ncbi:xylulokinase [Selenomonas ruminantium]|uniref:Xylulose kinase n=1 Tax=Selenomonas ruminantium TaxID=971 RepID=A0A1M6WEP3_SELRU|nr:xylulokinase [Selenomonas ruminantium]SHK92273.1 xylulokinase [Selenomonas ruminantium]